MTHFRSTRALIDGGAILNNYQQLAARQSRGYLMPVIKADAYGHNALETANLLSEHVKAFAVAIVDEGIALRHAGIKTPIIVLEGAMSSAALIACCEYDLTSVIHCQYQVDVYGELDKATRPACWVKYDIGMHRLGFSEQDIDAAWDRISTLAPHRPTLCGHFSCADDPNSMSTQQQLVRFKTKQAQFSCRASLANSPAILQWPESHVDWNRAGIALYGISASSLALRPEYLRPAMSLLAPVIAIRTIPAGDTVGYGDTWTAKAPSRIATIAIGYADGYPRHAPCGTPISFGEKRAPLVGRVSMDMITVDITHIADVEIGSEAELWGEHLAVEEVADYCGTIAYELVTRVGPRVPKYFT